jgi:hypothetical protein
VAQDKQGGFGLEPDLEAIAALAGKLNPVAMEVAVQAAYDAAHAGLESVEELQRCIAGYLWAVEELKKVVP